MAGLIMSDFVDARQSVSQAMPILPSQRSAPKVRPPDLTASSIDRRIQALKVLSAFGQSPEMKYFYRQLQP